MSRFSNAIALVALLFGAATVLAADAPSKPLREPSPMIAELLELNVSEGKQLAKLYEEFAASSDEESAIAIQRRIEALQRSTEIQILSVQLRYAREGARLKAVRQLEEVLNILRSNTSGSE